MEHFFFSFWWLVFPLGFFIAAGFDRWLAYKKSQDRLQILRGYTDAGKDPPPELIRALARDEEADEADDAYAPYDRYGRYPRRYYRRYWRHGPYWAWRAAIVTGAVAGGFWLASEYGDIPGVELPFRLVAIIMTCVAAGNLVAAIFSSTFRGR
jgi:hypothetical protein